MSARIVVSCVMLLASSIVYGQSFNYRGIMSWSDARLRCENQGLTLPSALELQSALRGALLDQIPELLNGRNCSGGIAAIWTGERANEFSNYLAVASDGREAGFSGTNRFHAVCISRGADNPPPPTDGTQRSFQCVGVDAAYPSLQNYLRVSSYDRDGSLSVHDLFTFHYRTKCQDLATRLTSQCANGPCSLLFCESNDAAYPSLENKLYQVRALFNGTLQVNSIAQYSYLSECEIAAGR